MGRISRMLKNAHENADKLKEVKLANDGKIPAGMLSRTLEDCTNEVE